VLYPDDIHGRWESTARGMTNQTTIVPETLILKKISTPSRWRSKMEAPGRPLSFNATTEGD
jgi:hypothetical protein